MFGYLYSRNSLFVRSLFAFLTLLPFTIAHSQLATASKVDDDNLVIEEIIVMAQKREKAAQDVPVSMTVFTDRELVALNLPDVAEIDRYTPNLGIDKLTKPVR